MNKFLPFGIFVLSGFLVFSSFVGEGSLPRLLSLSSGLSEQKQKNDQLAEYVATLNQDVAKLQADKRFLEKAARNEKAMAKPGELIFLFDEQ